MAKGDNVKPFKVKALFINTETGKLIAWADLYIDAGSVIAFGPLPEKLNPNAESINTGITVRNLAEPIYTSEHSGSILNKIKKAMAGG